MLSEEHPHTRGSGSSPAADKVYLQQGGGNQNLFAFLQPTSNCILSFVSADIFPYFILFLLSFRKKGTFIEIHALKDRHQHKARI